MTMILPIAPLIWAQRLKRVFELDITLCPHCGGRLRVIADVTEPSSARSSTTSTNAPGSAPSRSSRQSHELAVDGRLCEGLPIGQSIPTFLIGSHACRKPTYRSVEFF